MSEVIVRVNGWAEQRFRLFRHRSSLAAAEPLDMERTAEHIVALGPIPLDSEVASRIDGLDDGLASDGEFFTDESCWFTVRRQFNASLQANPLTNIAANYKPHYHTAFARTLASSAAPRAQLTLLTAHSRGVTGGDVARNVSLESMLHRRLSASPAPVGGLDDNSTVSSVAALMLASPQASAAWRHRVGMQLQHPLVPFVRTYGAGVSGGNAASVPMPLADLPPSIHLLNFDVWSQNSSSTTVLLRLAHLAEAGEHPVLSNASTVDVAAWLRPWAGRVVSWEERALDAVRGGRQRRRGDGSAFSVTLQPLDIFTGLVQFDVRNE